MTKPLSQYIRWCRRCGELFETTCRCGKFCDKCRKQGGIKKNEKK